MTFILTWKISLIPVLQQLEAAAEDATRIREA